MMDFYDITVKSVKKGEAIVEPEFFVLKSKDLMIRGKDFYAIWDEENGLWSLDENSVISKIDKEMLKAKAEYQKVSEDKVKVKYMRMSSTGTIDNWHKYVQKQMRDNFTQLDSNIIFSNQETKKEDYASKKLSYPLKEGPHEAYDEIMSTLYDESERRKLEWAIGAIISGDAKNIQKFIVLFGAPGTGKSTFLKIVKKLFEGYCGTFDSKKIATNDPFALEAFKSNPLIALDDEGDLSKIETNTRLNGIVSHDTMLVNEKNRPHYAKRFDSFLMLCVNKPVKITDAKSGLLRRLIDVTPSGRTIPFRKYSKLMKQIDCELSGIAWHCLEVYKDLGETYYNNYIPTKMIGLTNDFYDFMETYYDTFDKENGVSLTKAWTLYKEYTAYANVQFPFGLRQVRVELENYFDERKADYFIDGNHYTNYYIGFKRDKFPGRSRVSEDASVGSVGSIAPDTWLIFKDEPSILDSGLEGCKAQYAKADGTPERSWDKVTTKLMDLDTHRLHYILMDNPQHIIIDFDIKGPDGKKSLERNIEAASNFPKTYAELSKSGCGIHLHYIYDGDVDMLSRVYGPEIEVKVFKGKLTLRRMLTKCCNNEIRIISSGLPLKEKKGGEPVIDMNVVNLEKSLRTTIKKCLNKEVHDSTAPNVQFIKKILDDAYASGKPYDVSDMRQAVLLFANNSTNQARECIKLYNQMKWQSEEERIDEGFPDGPDGENSGLVFYDVEIFPNLFVVCWNEDGSDIVHAMKNPKPIDLEPLMSMKLIGFNNRKYDNHILYAGWAKGYSTDKLFKLSQRIISEKDRNATFKEAYNLSYTDVYDFCATKMSLKKWEIKLGIHHLENEYPWDKDVPEDMWDDIVKYCSNDVLATKKVFYSNKEDFAARELLCDLSNILTGTGTVNDTTNQLTTRIILRGDKDANKKFVYPDLSKLFPGYEFSPTGIDPSKYNPGTKIVNGKSLYLGEDPGEGGYVYADPGMYYNVVTFDVASMHPSSIVAENGFGPYTKNFKELLDIRLYIKRKEYDKVKAMYNGALAKYLTATDPEELKKQAKALSYALKIAINSVYGLTSAGFENALRDPRNIDNWVAKRGALMMICLKNEVLARGFKVIHCKTDSIKVVCPSKEIEDYILEFGKRYGYTFEIEAKYDRICLVNDAVYVAKESMWEGNDYKGMWTATGAQFRKETNPYVFKTLFSKEPIEFDDMCETKSVETALYLDFNEELPEDDHALKFVGKVGMFTPVVAGAGGGELKREKDGKYSYAAGAKGYRWLESEVVKNLGIYDKIDQSYYRALCDSAVENISKFGNFDEFVNGVTPDFMNIPEGVNEDEGLPFD